MIRHWFAIFIVAVVMAYGAPAMADPQGNFNGVFAGPATHYTTDFNGNPLAPNAPGSVLRLFIDLVNRTNNFRFQTLIVEKILNFAQDPFPTNGRPDFSSYDGTYTFTDDRGDKLVANSTGYAFNKPDQTAGFAEEILAVNPVQSTGRFAGATGAGRVHSLVTYRPNFVLDDDVPDSDVVKYVTAEVTLAR